MWYRETQHGIELFVKVMSKSSKNEIVGLHGGMLKIKIHAIPNKGKANDELIEFLSDIFLVPKQDIDLLRGEHQKIKKIFISASLEKVRYIINSIAKNSLYSV